MTFRIVCLFLLVAGINVAAFMSKNDSAFAANLPTVDLALKAMDVDRSDHRFVVTGQTNAGRWELIAAPVGSTGQTVNLEADQIRDLAGEGRFVLEQEQGDQLVYSFDGVPAQLAHLTLDQPYTGSLHINKETLTVERIYLQRKQAPPQQAQSDYPHGSVGI